ncbi:hypothetical protein K426_10080 [Sphingobium sp. TKS]|nr:hypothetical protein K426_10080 [Sphingobium sp. TKS]
MCVLALAWRVHANWPFIVAGNRDEFHGRPARRLQRWDQPDHVLAGKDRQSGGTWLGVSEEGRFAVVTNLRGFGPSETGRPSRGVLLRDLLAGEGRYAEPSDTDLMDFNPFNLILIRPAHAEFWSNKPNPARRRLPSGVYGLSNGALDESWPKSVSCAFASPIETATISVPWPFSFRRIASSTAISSKGFMDIFTLARSTPVPSGFTRGLTL